ncbi:MAG: acyl-CoA dehydratase activase [Desulfarculaceae bacterium]|nr:acyl-CoA dehydratase activase [Desulfarculaceae bacterium]MCF8074476.1 acyl-CoA dehydratase activase [Desulfarculaceae bacterium]MCF8103682.1 acyl-CoA dehydratase activase [Desulfarculaceae bacterium]
MSYYAGIDVGSLSSDAVIVDAAGGIKGWAVTETGAHSTNAASAALDKALERAGLRPDQVAYTVATGYGRAAVPQAGKKVTEITCHALGAYTLFPEVGTVVDIGGQDSKVIRLGENGKVVDFVMNDKCAAGTGRFLEVMAAKLGVTLDDLGRLSLGAEGEVAISSVCTVFAESEVVSLVAKNQPIPQIIKGLHRAVVNRVAAMTGTTGVREQVIMSGGVAKNAGVVKLMAERLGVEISVPDEPQIVGALGAALLAAREDAV